MDEEIKLRKEKFILNYDGTSLFENFILIVVVPFFIYCHFQLVNFVGSSSKYLEILFIAIPTLLFYTLIASWDGPEYRNTLVFFFLVLLISNFSSIQTINHPSEIISNNEKIPSLTSLRGITLLSTCIAILAVDFPVFPRRLAKTEFYGTGLMDFGVGAYILTGSISRALKAKRNNFIRNNVYLLCIGLCRLVLVYMSNYQNHASEYGLHWNFFFTLAIVDLLSNFNLLWFSNDYNLWGGVILLFLYQFLLIKTNLGQNILSNNRDVNRDNLFWLNKEGLSSCIGYFCLSLISQSVVIKYKTKLFEKKQLFFFVCFFCFTLNFCIVFIERICRRSANLSFCLWIWFSAVVLLFLSSFNFQSKLMEKLSKNQLKVFLFANVCTGLVNFSFITMEANLFESTSILIIYVTSVCLFAFWI